MITMYASTNEEYDTIMKYAQNYICRRLPFDKCYQSTCEVCYRDNHIEADIYVFRRVDDKDMNEL